MRWGGLLFVVLKLILYPLVKPALPSYFHNYQDSLKTTLSSLSYQDLLKTTLSSLNYQDL